MCGNLEGSRLIDANLGDSRETVSLESFCQELLKTVLILLTLFRSVPKQDFSQTGAARFGRNRASACFTWSSAWLLIVDCRVDFAPRYFSVLFSESVSTGVCCVPGFGAGFEIALEPSKLQK